MKTYLYKIFWAACCGALIIPAVASAQLTKPPCPEGLRCPGEGGTSVNTVYGLINTVTAWLLSIAFALAVLFLIIGGLFYITSGGNEESAERAKNTVVNAIIGIIIILLSYVIINVITNALSGGSTAAGP